MMKTFNSLRSFALVGTLTLLTASGALADGFSIKDLDGRWGNSISGHTTDPFGNPVLPFSAVGQMTIVNGFTNGATRTLNIGGLGLVDSTFVARATVDPDGRGVAVFCGDNVVRLPAPPWIFPRKSVELFEFVITGRNRDELAFIGTGFESQPVGFDIQSCPSPVEVSPLIPLSGVSIGTAEKQGNGDDDG